MSSVKLEDKDGGVYRPDVFERQEGADTVVIQSVTNVDPATGAPVDHATETTLAGLSVITNNLLTAANAIKAAAEGLNGKTTAVNTGAIAGTVALDNATLTALENVNAQVSGTVSLDSATLTALETVNVTTDPNLAQDTTLQAVKDLTETIEVLISQLTGDKMRTDERRYGMVRLATIDGNLTLGVVNAVGVLSGMGNTSFNLTTRDTAGIPQQTANAGAVSVYDQLKFA